MTNEITKTFEQKLDALNELFDAFTRRERLVDDINPYFQAHKHEIEFHNVDQALLLEFMVDNVLQFGSDHKAYHLDWFHIVTSMHSAADEAHPELMESYKHFISLLVSSNTMLPNGTTFMHLVAQAPCFKMQEFMQFADLYPGDFVNNHNEHLAFVCIKAWKDLLKQQKGLAIQKKLLIEKFVGLMKHCVACGSYESFRDVLTRKNKDTSPIESCYSIICECHNDQLISQLRKIVQDAPKSIKGMFSEDKLCPRV